MLPTAQMIYPYAQWNVKALVLLSKSVFITFNLWKRQTKTTIGFELRKAYWFYPLILCTVAQWFYCMQICGRLLMNCLRAENIPCREKTLCHMWYEQSETKNACIVASSGMFGVLLLLGNISPTAKLNGKTYCPMISELCCIIILKWQ